MQTRLRGKMGAPALIAVALALIAGFVFGMNSAGGASAGDQAHAAGGYLSQSTQTLHFGLGERTKVDWAKIRWHGHVKPERLDNPTINTLHKRAEPDGTGRGQKVPVRPPVGRESQDRQSGLDSRERRPG